MTNMIGISSTSPLIEALGGTGNNTGNAPTATIATEAINVNTTSTNTNTSFYIPFAPSFTTGYQALGINSNLSYNPLTGILNLENITLIAPAPSQLIGLNSGGTITAVGAGTSTTILHGNAAGLPTYSSVVLTTDVTGILPNANTTATNANTASAIVARDSSGNFTAGTITATLNGNASTATDATGFFTTAVSNNASFYPILVNQTTNSYQTANLNSGFSINPSTGTVTATTFSGALSGTATNATNVATTQVTTNASFFPLMVASSTNGNQAADLGTGFTYNPSTNTLATTNMTLSSLTLRSVLYVSASAGIIGDASNFNYDGANHNLYIGTNNVSTLNGHGRLNLLGTDSTIGASQAYYTTNDLYPLIQILPYAHDNVLFTFDAYFSSGWVSSSTSSSFQIAKTASALNLNYGVAAQGSTVTWTTGISMSTTGAVTIPTLTLTTATLSTITKTTITVFTGGASGNYTPPAGCTSILVKGWGGGGGGGGVAGAASSAGGAGGGGSGGYFQILLTAPFGGAPFAYAVGSGGAGGASGANNGSVGGSTTFGTLTAGHGDGGGGVTSGVTAAIGAGGNISASSGTADIISTGNAGVPGFALSSTVAVGGNGAAAPFGGAGGRGGLTGTGGAGAIPGGGGAGGALTSNSNVGGGIGGDGKLLIYEYYNG